MASKIPECSICFEHYNDQSKCPRILNCGHSFCSSCLERLLHDNFIECPTCRNPVAVSTGVQGLINNFALLDMINEAANEQSILCPDHNDQFRFFDEDCGHVICRDCYILNHNRCRCVKLADAASKYRPEMEALVAKVSSGAQKIKAAEAQVIRTRNSVKEALERQHVEIQAFFGQLHEELNNREHFLQDKLVRLFLSKDSILTEQLDGLRLDKTFLESLVQQAKASIQSPSDVQFLLSVPDIFSTFKAKQCYYPVLEPEAQFLPEFTKEEKYSFGMAPFYVPSSKSLKEAIQSAGDISDRSTSAANTTATGEGITTGYTGRKATFTIISRDSQNRQRNQGGDVYEVKLIHRGSELRNVSVKLEDQKDGTYLAEYNRPFGLSILRCGYYTLSVCLRGEHIQGSPFSVQVKI